MIIEIIIGILEFIGYIGLWCLYWQCQKLLKEVKQHTKLYYSDKVYDED